MFCDNCGCHLGEIIGLFCEECGASMFPRNLTETELFSQNNNESMRNISRMAMTILWLTPF